MSKSNLTLNSRKLRRNLKKAERLFGNQQFAKKVYKEWLRVTPRGETKEASKQKNNRLIWNKRQFKIIGDYDYSGVIDRGEYPNPPKTVKPGKRKTRGGYSKDNLRRAKPYKGLVQPSLQFAITEFKKFIRRLK